MHPYTLTYSAEKPMLLDKSAAILRDDLTHLKALVAHWREDAEANLTPTTETLEAASWRIRDALENLDALTKETA